jgi:hypothetical protein
MIVSAIEAAGYEPGRDISIALDPSASSFYRDNSYDAPSFHKGSLAENDPWEYVGIGVPGFPSSLSKTDFRKRLGRHFASRHMIWAVGFWSWETICIRPIQNICGVE